MAHHARAAAGRRALPPLWWLLLPVVRLVLPAEDDALLLLLRLVPFGAAPDPGRPPCRERRAESAAAIVLFCWSAVLWPLVVVLCRPSRQAGYAALATLVVVFALLAWDSIRDHAHGPVSSMSRDFLQASLPAFAIITIGHAFAERGLPPGVEQERDRPAGVACGYCTRQY